MPLASSVILCTCQGERFLGEQLASLRAQTRLPTEILAQDDASVDGTFAILEREKLRSSAISYQLHHNPVRLGFAANFASALARARGEVLFFCDQDDIWEPEKVATLLARFEADPSLQLACSEASKIDAAGSPLPGLVLESNGLGAAERAGWSRPYGAFPRLVRKNAVPGMTMAIRSSLRARILPVPPGWEHDYWTLLVTAGLGLPIAVEDRPLVRYRQHQGQVIGGEKTLNQRWTRAEGQSLADRAQEAERWIPLRNRLAGAEPWALALLEEKRAHLERRGGFPHARLPRTAAIALELLRGGYHRFDSGLSSAFKDFLSG